MTQTWHTLHQAEFQKPYFKNLQQFLAQAQEGGEVIYPPADKFFEAFNICPLNKTKVVILGQDPYHGPSQAHGLSFSVQKGTTIPPSLKNIHKELKSDLNIPIPEHGNLETWAQQGVLLLNSTLSVRHKSPASHAAQGWETFTDTMIQAVSDHQPHVVFLLWGKFAQSKKSLIDAQKHLVLEAAHPSPFSAHRGFLGCQHFSKTNTYLKSYGIAPIDWQIK